MPGLLSNPDELLAERLAAVSAAGIGLESTAADVDYALTTGRQIVTMRPDDGGAALAALQDVAGGGVARSSDFEAQDVSAEGVEGASVLVFDELGIALVDDVAAAAVADAGISVAESTSGILAVEPEIFMFPSGVSVDDYLRGFAAAAARIRDDLGAGAGAAPDMAGEDDPAAAVAGITWGIAAVRAAMSGRTGAGIKVAILDTGLDLLHPEFAGRAIVHSSFIAGQTAQDRHSHGTHCTGTACGPKAPAGATPRYGVASQALIHVGKVLSDTGGGTSGSVLAGMNWAVAQRCEVISMSLGAPGGPFAYYTQAGQLALNAGCLIIAAAGNESNRPGVIRPVGAPANSPTIMGVAALDPNLAVAYYSNGGAVDIAGPGSNVFSTVPMPVRHGVKSGTSMATPHVAGCAALLAQTGPGMRGMVLWNRLLALARPLPRPASDVGRGLVRAVP